jgi:hypothetical protein
MAGGGGSGGAGCAIAARAHKSAAIPDTTESLVLATIFALLESTPAPHAGTVGNLPAECCGGVS